MVTSVTSDTGRRLRLLRKSHIQAPGPIAVVSCQIPELSFCRAKRERQKESKTILSSFPTDVWVLCYKAQDWLKVALIGTL